MEVKDMLGVPVKRQEKLIDIEAGDIFGEDFLCYQRENTYSIVAITPKVTCMWVAHDILKTNYKRLPYHMTEFFNQRNEFL